jgi:creatinine amidohydrolase
MRKMFEMEKMTVKMVKDYLAKKKSIIIPYGVIEQHGYHLPLNTDALIAKKLSLLIGEKTETLVAPVMYESFSGGDCPGTINISPAVMSLVMSDMLVSLVSQGFRNFYILPAHGGSENTRALDNALKFLLRTNPAFKDVMLVLMPIWKLAPKKSGHHKAFSEGDWHAGWFETSLVMALEPELVRMDELALDPDEMMKLMVEHPDNYQHAEKIVDDELVVPRMSQRKEIKVGVMGYHPEKATRELGRKAIDYIVKFAAKKINQLEAHADGIYKEVEFIPEPIILQ